MLSPDEVQARVTEVLLDMRDMRERREISQKTVGLAMGLGQGNYSALERGKVTPNLGTLIRWADALGCDLVVMPMRRKKV